MQFREFVKYLEQDWFLDPTHVWFDDPEMTRFLNPEELDAMYAVKKRLAQRSIDTKHQDPGATRAYVPSISHKMRVASKDFASLSRDLEEIKRRLEKLEMGYSKQF
jgi:hypothetical protein